VGLSPVVHRGILAILAVGFLLTSVLAWYHGEKGRQRVSGPELLLIALLLGIAGGGLYLIRGSGADGDAQGAAVSTGTERREDPRTRILVLACRNISPDPDDAYVAEGLHEAILHKLGGISNLLPLGPGTAAWYRDNPKPPAQIAVEQRVDFLGECGIRKYREEGRLFITFQLLNDEGGQVWSEEYDRDLSAEAEFEIQADVARQVAERVQAGLTQDERDALRAGPTGSLEAWDAYQQGRALNSRPGPENARRAIDLLKEATRLDPEFAAAWVELGTAYRALNLYTTTLDPAPLADSAQLALERGIRLDGQNAEAFAALSYFLLVWRWDLAGAEQAMERALSLNPGLPEVRLRNAVSLLYTGRSGEALREVRRALEQDPLGVVPNGWLALILASLGRHEEAKVQNERALDFDPTNAVVLGNLGGNYLRLGMPDSAAAVFRRVEAEENPAAVAGLVNALVQLGRREEAVRIYDDLRSFADQRRVSKAQLAEAAFPLDEDQAFDLLVQAVEERDRRLLDGLMLNKDRWDPSLRREILNRMGLDLEGERLVVFEGGS
jgi:serine/threonine-protein kinase